MTSAATRQLEFGFQDAGQGAQGAEQLRTRMHAPVVAEVDVGARDLVAVAAQAQHGGAAAIFGQRRAQLSDKVRANAIDAQLQQARAAFAGFGQWRDLAYAYLVAAGETVLGEAAFDHEQGIAGQQVRILVEGFAEKADLDAAGFVFDAREGGGFAAATHGGNHTGDGPRGFRRASV